MGEAGKVTGNCNIWYITNRNKIKNFRFIKTQVLPSAKFSSLHCTQQVLRPVLHLTPVSSAEQRLWVIWEYRICKRKVPSQLYTASVVLINSYQGRAVVWNVGAVHTAHVLCLPEPQGSGGTQSVSQKLSPEGPPGAEQRASPLTWSYLRSDLHSLFCTELSCPWPSPAQVRRGVICLNNHRHVYILDTFLSRSKPCTPPKCLCVGSSNHTNVAFKGLLFLVTIIII